MVSGWLSDVALMSRTVLVAVAGTLLVGCGGGGSSQIFVKEPFGVWSEYATAGDRARPTGKVLEEAGVPSASLYETHVTLVKCYKRVLPSKDGYVKVAETYLLVQTGNGDEARYWLAAATEAMFWHSNPKVRAYASVAGWREPEDAVQYMAVEVSASSQANAHSVVCWWLRYGGGQKGHP